MKLAMLALLIHPLMILGPTGLFAATRLGHQGRRTIPAPHGFSEILYEFTLGVGQQRLRLRGAGRHLRLRRRRQRRPGARSAHWDIACGLVMLHRPLHPDHRPARVRRRAWRRRSRRRSRSARCAPTRSRSASCCWARSCWSGRCCSCRRPCWARWPSTWGRCRSAAKTTAA